MEFTNFDGSADFVREGLTTVIRHGCEMRVGSEEKRRDAALLI